MKKILAFLLAALMIIGVLPATTFAAGETYTKISSVSELTTGTYVITFVGGGTTYAAAPYSSNWITTATPTISGDQVTDAKGATWTITVNGSSATLMDANGTYVKPKSGNNNGIQTGEYSWNVTCSNGTFQFNGAGSDTSRLAANSGSSYKLRAYKTSTANGTNTSYPCNFTLYKLDDGNTGCAEHTPEVVTGTPATCTENGLTDGSVCSVCKAVLTAQEEIPALGHDVVNGTCQNCGEAMTMYDLVTDVTELTTGSQIIIVATEYDKAMGAQSGNNCAAIDVAKEGTQVALDGAIQVLTVEEGTLANTYAFNTGSGYLYAASSSSNHLKLQADKDANASWAITIADGVATVKAQGTNTRNWMRYNTTSTIFSCYAETSTQLDIAIYKLAGTGSEPVECDHPTSTVQDDAVAPTCTTVGFTASEKCDTCGATTKFAEEIPALGHTYVDYACSTCMAIDPASPLTATRLFEAPANGDKVVVYHYSSKLIMSATFSGTRLVGVSSTAADGVLPYGASAAVLTVIVTEDGEYAFQFADGKYLATGETGGNIVLADELDDLSLWTVTALEAGAFNIVNNGATYNGTDYNQALECYSGNFTTYGLQTTAAFQIDLYLVEAAAPEHTHTELIVEGKAPTCTETGLTEGKICADCKEILVAQEEIPALGHTPEAIPAVDATCTATGLTAGEKCAVCGEITKAQEETAALGHTWDEGVYTDPTAEADGFATYTCTVCGETEVEIDEGSKLPEIVDPAITKQPEAVNAETGTSVQFHVEAAGEVVSYKWQYRKIFKWFDTTMEGYNTDTLTVPAIGSRNGYDYRCTITYADGTVLVSEPAELTVNTYVNITYQPNDQTVVLGYKGQFTAAAEGEGIKYQWQYQRPDGERWIDTTMDGCTKPTVNIETTTARDGYKYRCMITDVAGVVTYTEAATMRVLSFKEHPQEAFAANGSTAQFTVAVSVSEGFTYQWQYSANGGATWSDTTMSGYNTATLTVDATNARNGYQYRCVLTGSKNSKIESKAAILHVGDPVVISAQPADVTCAVGEVATFSVEAANAYAYQWQFYNPINAVWKNTSAEGNTTETVNVTVKSNNNNYQYRCIIYGLDGMEYISDAATLTIG